MAKRGQLHQRCSWQLVGEVFSLQNTTFSMGGHFCPFINPNPGAWSCLRSWLQPSDLRSTYSTSKSTYIVAAALRASCSTCSCSFLIQSINPWSPIMIKRPSRKIQFPQREMPLPPPRTELFPCFRCFSSCYILPCWVKWEGPIH